MTTALEGGEGSASRPGRSLPPGKTQYPLYRRLVGPPGHSGQVRKISPPPGFNPQTVQLVASQHTNNATRPIIILQAFSIKRNWEDDRAKYGMLELAKGNMRDMKAWQWSLQHLSKWGQNECSGCNLKTETAYSQEQLLQPDRSTRCDTTALIFTAVATCNVTFFVFYAMFLLVYIHSTESFNTSTNMGSSSNWH
jgi:hypothetical protein